jgi:hypothetical protein
MNHKTRMTEPVARKIEELYGAAAKEQVSAGGKA